MNEQWFLLGDIHGSAQPVHYFYQKNKERLSLDSLVRGIINSNQSFQNCHLLLYV